jgi:hypothetical protein
MDCWATPYQDANGVLQHHLIEEGCGVENVLDGTLKIYENGKSKMSKFAGSVFKFVGYNQVWLHCNIRVCFGDENCSNQCENGNRRRRDAEEDETIYTVSTAHPIRKIELDIELDQISINGNQTPGIFRVFSSIFSKSKKDHPLVKATHLSIYLILREHDRHLCFEANLS